MRISANGGRKLQKIKQSKRQKSLVVDYFCFLVNITVVKI